MQNSIKITIYLVASFIFIFNVCIIAQQQEIQAFQCLIQDPNNPTFYEVVSSWNRTDPNQLYWSDDYRSSLPIQYFEMGTLPYYFETEDQANISNQVNDAISQWNNAGCQYVYYDALSPVYLGFSDNPDFFNRGSETTPGGFTALAVDYQNDK